MDEWIDGWIYEKIDGMLRLFNFHKLRMKRNVRGCKGESNAVNVFHQPQPKRSK